MRSLFGPERKRKRKRVRSPLRREEGLRRSGPGHRRLRDKRDKRERSTCAGGEVLLADMDDRVDDSVDRLAQRKRHGGVRVQNRPLREEKRTVNRVFVLRIILKKGKVYIKSSS